MYICMCNPFTDKDLDGALKNEAICNKASALYKACSGGENPNCGNCICEIKGRIDAHNSQILLMAAE